MKVAVAGKIEFNYGFKRMTNPFIEEVGGRRRAGDDHSVHGATGRCRRRSSGASWATRSS